MAVVIAVRAKDGLEPALIMPNIISLLSATLVGSLTLAGIIASPITAGYAVFGTALAVGTVASGIISSAMVGCMCKKHDNADKTKIHASA